MFEALSRGFREAQNRLSGLTELNATNIKTALREVRVSLLEADVELGIVKGFIANVETKALGQTVKTRIKHAGQKHQISASEQFIKLCHDELIAMMGSDAETVTFSDSGPTGVMMVGLQGSGKTTSTAKLGRWFQKQGKKPLLVAADMQRPAAVEQLQVLGAQLDIPVFNINGASPLTICSRAKDEATKQGCNVIIYDTAGRLAIDDALMAELSEIHAAVEPHNTYLVVDAMMGQDAVSTSRQFSRPVGASHGCDSHQARWRRARRSRTERASGHRRSSLLRRDG